MNVCLISLFIVILGDIRRFSNINIFLWLDCVSNWFRFVLFKIRRWYFFIFLIELIFLLWSKLLILVIFCIIVWCDVFKSVVKFLLDKLCFCSNKIIFNFCEFNIFYEWILYFIFFSFFCNLEIG